VATFRYVLIDVFTDTPLEGNALAVFTDAREIPEEMLQPIAREMNLSETVFVYPSGWDFSAMRRRSQGETGSAGTGDRQNNDETVYVYPAEAGGHARIRIFTPMDELPFAGHPVLGTAFVLAAPLQLPEIVLETGKGHIPVRLERKENRISFGWMSQPVPTVEPFADADELLAAVGVESSELPIEAYDNGARHVYVALPSVEAVEALEPDLQALKRLQGIVGTNCFAGEGDRWKTRMFAPADGVPEDPATGSAAGPLACHLARHGRTPFATEIVISQGAEIRRPSTLHARVTGSAEKIERVDVGGSAVIVARGEFKLG
jgi:trans-2,3-dihydro-3-hydroxyanthranilate isomerase